MDVDGKEVEEGLKLCTGQSGGTSEDLTLFTQVNLLVENIQV